MALIDLANPTRFISLVERLLPALVALSLGTLALGLYLAFFVAPDDYQQGGTVRIMFIHVPAAWLAMFCWTMMSISALGTLVWRHPLSDVAARAAVPIGATFTFVCLVTGSLWGKPMWGTWWMWDARLTSVLVLFIMYLGLVALWNTIDDPIRAGKAAAVLTLVGFVNIPIIKFSVDWWYTLHQPASVIRLDGPTIHASILWPLLVMAVAFTFVFTTLHLLAMRNEIMRRRVRTMRMMAAARTEASVAVTPDTPAASAPVTASLGAAVKAGAE